MSDSARKPAGFAGTIGTTLADSVPAWAPRPSRPSRPNVIVVLCDDLGFSDIGCFGSEIETPNLDALAHGGVRLGNFHATPLCSPSRAALLTGLNHHEAGMGTLAGHDYGFPGYRGELADDVLTAAEVFRHNGYRTLAVGKWHLAHMEDGSDAGDRGHWPLQRGFDRFYGFMENGFTNFHQPNVLHEDNHTVAVEEYPPGYYFTDDITDKAIGMIRGVKAVEPARPFFLYFAHAAVHAPLMAKPADMTKYRGRYDIGWDAVRAARFARQKELGIVPADAQLPPPNDEPDYETSPWDSLDDRERELCARYMEVYAGMVDSVDQSWGRLRDELARLGELDNTLVLFTADNGASREGGARGTTEFYWSVAAVHAHEPDREDTFERDYARLDLIGGPQVMAHYPWSWGAACNTPFRLHKGTTYQGGHHVTAIVSWPGKLDAPGSVRFQYAHLIDVLPTMTDVLGLDVPGSRNGIPVRPMRGVSFGPVLTDADAPSSHTAQYYEISGHRAYYQDGWEAVTLHHPRADYDSEPWHLYHLDADPTQVNDLAATHQERLSGMIAAWDLAAKENWVYPLEDGTGRFRLRDPGVPLPSEPLTIRPGAPTLSRTRSAQLVQYRSFTIAVELSHGAGDRGVLLAHGDQGGGYSLYVDDHGVLTFAYNYYSDLRTLTAGKLPDGTARLLLEVDADAGMTWRLRLLVNDAERIAPVQVRALAVLAPFTGISVGRDAGSPVNWELAQRHGPFPYTGTISSVTYTPGAFTFPVARRAETQALAEQRGQ